MGLAPELSDLSEPAGLAELPDLPGGAGAMAERLGITVVRARPDLVVGTMPVGPNTTASGLLHGGASCVLAESLGSIGAHLYAILNGGGYAVGVELSVSHHRQVHSGTVTGEAVALALGGPVVVYGIVVVDDSGGRVCTARLTCMVTGPVRRRVAPTSRAGTRPPDPSAP